VVWGGQEGQVGACPSQQAAPPPGPGAPPPFPLCSGAWTPRPTEARRGLQPSPLGSFFSRHGLRRPQHPHGDSCPFPHARRPAPAPPEQNRGLGFWGPPGNPPRRGRIWGPATGRGQRPLSFLPAGDPPCGHRPGRGPRMAQKIKIAKIGGKVPLPFFLVGLAGGAANGPPPGCVRGSGHRPGPPKTGPVTPPPPPPQKGPRQVPPNHWPTPARCTAAAPFSPTGEPRPTQIGPPPIPPSAANPGGPPPTRCFFWKSLPPPSRRRGPTPGIALHGDLWPPAREPADNTTSFFFKHAGAFFQSPITPPPAFGGCSVPEKTTQSPTCPPHARTSERENLVPGSAPPQIWRGRPVFPKIPISARQNCIISGPWSAQRLCPTTRD